MYKWHVKNNKVAFYEKGVEIDGRVYGIRSSVDIQKIKMRLALRALVDDEGNMPDDVDLEAEISKINHTDVGFEMPTDEQLARINSQSVYNNDEVAKLVDSVINNEVSQDEINAMLMLEIAELKARGANE